MCFLKEFDFLLKIMTHPFKSLFSVKFLNGEIIVRIAGGETRVAQVDNIVIVMLNFPQLFFLNVILRDKPESVQDIK